MNAVPLLNLQLSATDDGIGVRYRISGPDFVAGEVVAALPVSVAGVPAARIDGGSVVFSDDKGTMPCRLEPGTSPDGDEQLRWRAGRRSRGSVEVSYFAPARVVDATTKDGQPPVDLRRESGGVTGQGKVFLALPPIDGLWNLTVTWAGPASGLSSLGAGDLDLEGVQLEVLRDCHFMAGPVITIGQPGSAVTVHYLTPPAFDVDDLARRVARMHQTLADEMACEPAPYRVFLRSNPYRGLSGSALPGAFVAGWNAQSLNVADRLEGFIDHELVHEWSALDGPYQEVVWHNEGLADYYGVVLPYRAGLITASTFLDRVNMQARFAYASPFRAEPLAEVAPRYWTDFRAQQEPYYRGFFYFAQLAGILRDHGSSLETLIRQLRTIRRQEPVSVSDWQDMVGAATGSAGQQLLDEMVLRGQAPLPPDSLWGDDFRCQQVEAPIFDPGFDVTAFITGEVTGLRPGSPAAHAGLLDGDVITNLPDYNTLVRQPAGSAVHVQARRGGRQIHVQLSPGSDSARIPEWTLIR